MSQRKINPKLQPDAAPPSEASPPAFKPPIQSQEPAGNLRDSLNRLRDWSSLAGEIKLPADIMAAVSSGRPQLLALAQPRAFTEEESRHILHALAVLLDTNQQLQRHCQVIVMRVESMMQMLIGLDTSMGQLRQLADFNQPVDWTGVPR